MTDLELSRTDAAHLDWARKIARRGWGRAHPNPMVGCLLVRDDRVVGEGYHKEFGGPHAEIAALEQAKSRAEGATAYVSLEPCNHLGKTPPCAEALIGAGVRRVVYGAADPGAESGGGAERLRAAGLEVVGPVWDERTARAENPSFFRNVVHQEPFLALKFAISLDAKIAERPGARTRITGADAERESHRLRTGFHAIMVGAGTVRADDPRLTVRLVPQGRTPPARILLLSQPDVSGAAAVFEDLPQAPVHIFLPSDVREADIERLEGLGAHVHPVPAAPNGVDLAAVSSICWDLGMRSILCEGGARLAAALFAQQRIHRLYLWVAPTVVGAKGVAAFGGELETVAWDRFEPAYEPERHGRDTLIVLDRQEA